jgi:uncharacterized protein
MWRGAAAGSERGAALGLKGAVQRAALALALAVPLSGCAAMIGGYDLASNGLTVDEDAFRRALAFEAPRAYQTAVNGGGALPDDILLRLLFAGAAGRYAGAYDESSRLLDVASYLADDRVTISLSREALSLITSDRALAYVPGRTERLMIHYLAALNYLDAGNVDGAAVEARRIEALLDQAQADVGRGERSRDHQFLHYFAAMVFEAAGDWNAADVALRRAGPLARSLRARPADGSEGASLGHVMVLVEHGFVPHRVEQSVVIALPASQATMLTEGSAGEKLLAAADAAARVLLTASHQYGDRSGYYRDRGFRSTLHLEPWRDVESADSGNPYLLRMSWPVLYQEPAAETPVRVRVGELAADAHARLDVTAGVRADFDAQRATILARTLVRGATKLALSSAVEESIGKRDETAGRLAGLLTNLGTAAVERADTRAWHVLPGSISMVRLQLPAGSHELSLENDRGQAAPVATVTVRPGQTTFVTTRLWR